MNRRVNNPPLHNDVFNLAKNLFGFDAPAQKELKEEAAVKLSIASDTESQTMAVYPAIIDEAFSATMDNYRKFAALKNFQVSEENDRIKQFNNNVRNFKKENRLALSEVQLEFSQRFPKTYKSLNPTDYNEKVDEFAKEYGMLVQKKKMITLKPTAELVFQNIIFMYNQQLMKKNTRYISNGIVTKTPIERFKFNSWKVTQLKRNDVKSLDLCKKTILNHRKRFEELGVLINSEFHGWQYATSVEVNPQILVFKDIYNAKIVTPENQSLTSQSGKIVPNDNEKLTGTFLKVSEKSENGQADFLDKEFPSVTPSVIFYSNTSSKEQNSTEGAAPKNVKVSDTLSEKLESQIIHPQELAVRLANHEFDNHKPIPIRYLFTEAYRGTLTNEEFRELVIQDFFKSAAKIWKGKTAFAGSWKKAITLYLNNKWITHTGLSLNKAAIFEDIQQIRWRTEWARKWFISNNFNALFPYDYFDVTRTTSKEVGFEYTKAKWNEHLKNKEKYAALKKRREANAATRKIIINHAKKCENEIKRFYKNRITLTQLYDYVEKNLPAEYLEKLPYLISKHSLNITTQNYSTDGNDFAKYSPFEF